MFIPENSILIVIDIQGKLAHLMHAKEDLFVQVSKLIRAATLFEIPLCITEQVPAKLGRTIPEVALHLKEHHPIEKSSFSCCGNDTFVKKLKESGRRQVLISGIEAHVCIYQTVCDLLAKQYDVQVVGDAVASRSVDDKYYALDRMKYLGAGLTSAEMIICEWLRTSEHPKFKEVTKLIK
jgi:nicotinamidase-related amidase